jgi:hypothetical protein
MPHFRFDSLTDAVGERCATLIRQQYLDRIHWKKMNYAEKLGVNSMSQNNSLPPKILELLKKKVGVGHRMKN